MLVQMQLVCMLAMESCLDQQTVHDSKCICADLSQMCKAQQVMYDAEQLHAGCMRAWQVFEYCDQVQKLKPARQAGTAMHKDATPV